MEQEEKYHELIKEEPKNDIKQPPPFNLEYSTIVSNARKKIQASTPIQELLNDATLAAWVRDGREHHEGKRDSCAFCGNSLPKKIWEKLDNHFNQESEKLRIALNELIEFIKEEKTRIPKLLQIKHSNFYSKFTSKLEELEEQFSTCSTSYCSALDAIMKQLEKRKDDIFTPLQFNEPASIENDLNRVQNSYENLRIESNEFTVSLSTAQSNARQTLRLHEVFTFITDIKYSEEQKYIEKHKKEMDKAEKIKSRAQGEIDSKRKKINELKAQLKDESKGAERVNDYLNNFFGHQFLSLTAIEEISGNVSEGYRFEVTRDAKKAFHLSEGECSLIAFCYFMAKLEDIETKGNQPIIWIDDPISSLDANHIFLSTALFMLKLLSQRKIKTMKK